LKNFSTISTFYARSISMDNRHVNPLQAIGQITQFDPGSFRPFHKNPKSDIRKITIRLTRPWRGIASSNV